MRFYVKQINRILKPNTSLCTPSQHLYANNVFIIWVINFWKPVAARIEKVMFSFAEVKHKTTCMNYRIVNYMDR